MLKGNLNLSSDLKRLGYIKIFVWLTRPTSKTSFEQVLTRYKNVVKEYREKYGWKTDPSTGKTLTGQGIGFIKSDIKNEEGANTGTPQTASGPRKKEKKEAPAIRDPIALDHFQLAQTLGFLRRETNTWGRFGFILASQYADATGKPSFYDPDNFKTMCTTEGKGLVAVLSKNEQLIFCTGLLSSDLDGIAPMLNCLETESTKSDVMKTYFAEVAKWYKYKGSLETNANKRYSYLTEERRFIEKDKRKDEFEDQHREGQITPRLEFLSDLKLVQSTENKYHLTNLGRNLKDALIKSGALLPRLLDERENNLEVFLSELYGNTLEKMSFDAFKENLYRITGLDRLAGTLLISYEKTYLATAAAALNLSLQLPFSSFDNYLKMMEEQKKVYVSRTVPTRKYLKILS